MSLTLKAPSQFKPPTGGSTRTVTVQASSSAPVALLARIETRCGEPLRVGAGTISAAVTPLEWSSVFEQ